MEEVPPPTPPPASTPSAPAKRKNYYTAEDDVILMRQMLADLPFEAQRGCVIDAWDAVVGRVLTDPAFGVRTASGKTAQVRFNKLIDRHRQIDKAALRASGVEKEYGEREQLLDQLMARVDEHARTERERSDQERARVERLASAGDIIREKALARLREESDRDDRPSKQAKLTQLMTFLREDAEREARLRQEEYERQRAERQAEREAEREERKEERQMEHERMLALLKTFMDAQSQK